MPLVNISLRKGKSDDHVQAIVEGIHEAMVAAINVPAADRFMIVSEHDTGRLVADPTYLEINRTDDVVIVQITLLAGRSVEQKQAFYRRIVENLTANPGLRPEDVMVVLSENGVADWSFGNGVAQFANRSYEELRGGKAQ